METFHDTPSNKMNELAASPSKQDSNIITFNLVVTIQIQETGNFLIIIQAKASC